MSNLNEGIQPNTVSYWEERTINIGDYESRKFGLSITKKTVHINNVDKKSTIRANASSNYYESDNEQNIINKIKEVVKTNLDEQEFFIRSSVNDFVDHANLHKTKDLLGVEMEVIDDEIEAKPTKKKVSEFDDVDFEIEDD